MLRQLRDFAAAAGAVGGLSMCATWAIADEPGGKERYPYDPACPWGRLADGHGMLLRCLQPQEATALLGGDAPSPSPAREGGASASRSEPAPKPSADPVQPNPVAVSQVGPVSVDTGDLPLAADKLSSAKDRYIQCVVENGGLKAERARVVVRFLVRERGRAEGVSVQRREGMSKAAALCIADVVDRRYVGYPAAPIVGATIPIELGVRR